MPLFKVDVFDHYSTDKVKQVLDIIHKNAVASFQVPEGDRYQIVTRHKSDEMILEDTGLGFERTKDVIIIQVFSRKREKEMKLNFYKNVVSDFMTELNLSSKDVLISFFENGDEDWSFADGEAQFITGKL